MADVPADALDFFKTQGKRGGKAAAKKMTAEQRKDRAKKAAAQSAKVRSRKAAAERKKSTK